MFERKHDKNIWKRRCKLQKVPYTFPQNFVNTKYHTLYRQNIVAYLCGLVRIATKMVRCKTRCQYNLELRMTTRVGLYVFHCFTHTVTLWRTKTPTVQIWSRSVRQNRPSAIDIICKNNDLSTCRVEESSLSHNIIGGLKVWSYFS